MEIENDLPTLCNKKNRKRLIIMISFNTILFCFLIAINHEWASSNLYSVIYIYIFIIFITFLIWFILFTKVRYIANTSEIVIVLETQNEISRETQIENVSQYLLRNFKFKETSTEENLNNNNKCCSCTICMIELVNNDDNNLEFIKLSCNHQFCNKCISEWCVINNSCPLCKKEIIENTSYHNIITTGIE